MIYMYIDIENRQLKAENSIIKNINKNLFDEIQKYKAEDIQKEKKENEALKLKIKELEQISKNEKDALNLKFQEMDKNQKLKLIRCN